MALGIELHSIERGTSTVSLNPGENHIGLTESGAVHGGVLSAMIDSACGLAVLSKLTDPVSIATIDLSLHHIRPSSANRPIYAAAECCKLTRSVAFLRSTVYQEDENDLIAYGSATFMLGANHTKLYLQRDQSQ